MNKTSNVSRVNPRRNSKCKLHKRENVKYRIKNKTKIKIPKKGQKNQAT